MIYCHDRTGFGKSVALDNEESEIRPEILECRIDASASRDECPEFPPKSSMYLAIAPKSLDQRPRRIRSVKTAPDLVTQVFQQSRHGDDNGTSMVMDYLDDLSRMNFRREHRCASQEHRHKDTERLPEHVTEREKIQHAYGLKGSRPLFVFLDLSLKRPEIGADVSMSVNNALGLAGGPRCIHDFDDIIW